MESLPADRLTLIVHVNGPVPVHRPEPDVPFPGPEPEFETFTMTGVDVGRNAALWSAIDAVATDTYSRLRKDFVLIAAGMTIVNVALPVRAAALCDGVGVGDAVDVTALTGVDGEDPPEHAVIDTATEATSDRRPARPWIIVTTQHANARIQEPA